jgi:hypothetical protein
MGTFVLLLMMQQAFAFYTGIDTVQGGAAAGQSLIFQSTYSPADQYGYYGNIEFRGGLLLPNVYSSWVAISTTPPISGSITSQSSADYIWLVESNLVFGDVTLATTYPYNISTQDWAYIVFGWTRDRSGFVSSPTSYGIFFTKDVTVNTGVTFELYAMAGHALIEGNGNRLILKPYGRFAPLSDGVSGSVTIKNLTVLNAEGFSPGSAAGDLTLHNVHMDCSVNTAMQYGFVQGNAWITFSGMNNILSGGGYFNFTNLGASYTRILSNSKLYVGPQTIIRVGSISASSPGAGDFLFADATSVLFLDNCTLEIGNEWSAADNITFLKGTVYINGTVTLNGLGNSSVTLGDGVDPTNNCNMIFLPGSKLVLNSNLIYGAHNVWGSRLINKNV